jgi:hypothetical protein
VNSFQRAVLWIAAGLAGVTVLIVVANLNSIDPNGAVNVLIGAIVALVTLAVTGKRRDKDE